MRTVPIRVSLAASILALILVLAGAILAVNVLAARRIAEDLSDRYLAETERHVQEQIDGLFSPVVASLEHARDWARDGVVDPHDTLGSARVYRPLLASYPWISSIATGDEGGHSWRLGAEGGGYLVRVVTAGDAAAPAQFWSWTRRASSRSSMPSPTRSIHARVPGTRWERRRWRRPARQPRPPCRGPSRSCSTPARRRASRPCCRSHAKAPSPT